MRSPLRVESFSGLNRNENSARTFPSVLVLGLRDGATLIELRISTHSLGTKACSIHLSSIASCWGHPAGRVWSFFPLDRNKVSLDSWSVFLQDGVTLFGSGSRNLISSEGIPRVGLMGVFFFPGRPQDESHHPLVDRYALKSGSVPHSGVFAYCEVSVCTPLAIKGVGL